MIVLTLGTFDLFHVGHVRLLARCADIGPTTVGLNTDGFVTIYKGRPPIIPYADRREVLLACRYVDAVVANDQQPSAADVIDGIAPDVIVVGSDWEHRDYPAQLGLTQEWLDQRGIEVRFVSYTDGVSSSLIREMLR